MKEEAFWKAMVLMVERLFLEFIVLSYMVHPSYISQGSSTHFISSHPTPFIRTRPFVIVKFSLIVNFLFEICK
jgi:hypothetical protein